MDLHRYGNILMGMHPNLALHKHPHCVEVIQALDQCHQEHSFLKFFGYCNDAKKALDKCLLKEYMIWYRGKKKQRIEAKVLATKKLTSDDPIEGLWDTKDREWWKRENDPKINETN